MSDEYNAQSIKILSDAVAASRFQYEKHIELMKTYRVTRDFAVRIVEASALCGIEPELAMEKYVNGDKTITLPVEFDEIYRELLDNR